MLKTAFNVILYFVKSDVLLSVPRDWLKQTNFDLLNKKKEIFKITKITFWWWAHAF